MILNDRIPVEFYKLFRTKNREYYMELLVSIYEENNDLYSILGLTEEECKGIINEKIVEKHMRWELDEEENEEDTFEVGTASGILSKMVRWGWLKKDYDDKMNAYVLSFPEYSQLYVELFRKLQQDDDSQERESILTIYTGLYTYATDEDKNNDMLKNALRTSKSLGQLLANMQDGMRGYFDELSKQKEFLDIQRVLIDEINNNDSKKYQILTTTDSFYRYKEAVKELVARILNENDAERDRLEQQGKILDRDTVSYQRNQQKLSLNNEATELVLQIEREFDLIEKKYNRLIEQKTTFASRAAARIRYILQEGSNEEDNIIALINLLDRSNKKEEIMEQLQRRIHMSTSFRAITENSLYRKRERVKNEFAPQPVQAEETTEYERIEDFVPKPLYTRREIAQFMKKNQRNHVFETTEATVQSMDDLEKLLFVWQEMTTLAESRHEIEVDDDIKTESGYTFSKLMIREGE
ncbi:MAG: DUF5716 family protein [Lachnospiraceae bacterium]|nr:DUF5716 family protein [Lachnospiraceae bacterium]